MTLTKEIDQKIASLESQLEHVKGTETEIYARIVGYYRPVKNWNQGKKAEYLQRKTFDNPQDILIEERIINRKKEEEPQDNALPGLDSQAAESYLFFYRDRCPNCPPLKDYVDKISLSGKEINADSPEGMETALKYQVNAAPTLIFFNNDGQELFRASSLRQVEQFFN